MQTAHRIWRRLKPGFRVCVLFVYMLLFVLLPGASAMDISHSDLNQNSADSVLPAAIKVQLNDKRFQSVLYFPNSVKQFYTITNTQPAWITPGKDAVKTWKAMMMIDCVLQYGLSHTDYHPNDLLYSKLHDILEKPALISNTEKGRFDVLLTDAMIAFFNNLHFGKLNPDYPASRIDGETIGGFNAANILFEALKRAEFRNAVYLSQPKSIEYTHLQNYMRVVAGQETGDCYEVPDGVIKSIAINMERLRWAGIDKDTYVQINIPSFTLKFYQPDTAYLFKVIVGKPVNPSPTLQSAISYFTTAPEWNIPNKIFVKEILPKALKNSRYLERNHMNIYDQDGNWVEPTRANLAIIKRNKDRYHASQLAGCDNSLGLVVFRFPNIYDIYLHDTPEQKLFNNNERAFSHGCIRVEQAEKLANLIMENDHSADRIDAVHKAILARTTKTFTLKKTLPIKVTYLTCEVKNGILTQYPDLYDLDSSLELAIYGHSIQHNEIIN